MFHRFNRDYYLYLETGKKMESINPSLLSKNLQNDKRETCSLHPGFCFFTHSCISFKSSPRRCVLCKQCLQTQQRLPSTRHLRISVSPSPGSILQITNWNMEFENEVWRHHAIAKFKFHKLSGSKFGDLKFYNKFDAEESTNTHWWSALERKIRVRGRDH